MATKRPARKPSRKKTTAKKPTARKTGARVSGLEELERQAELELDSAKKAHQACALIRDFEAHPERYEDSEGATSGFHHIVSIFQQPTVQKAKDALRAEALPVLLRLYDTHLRQWRKNPPREPYDSSSGELLFALKIFAQYRGQEAIQRIIDAARIPLDPEGFMWSVVLSTLAEYDPPAATRVASSLARPLPSGFLGVALLDMANTLAREHGATPHPFDTPKGLERLRATLTDPDPEHFSYAHSAAASLPFLSDSRKLFAIAEKHPDLTVRMEAAWAAARSGDPRAIARLQEWSRNAKTRARALTYLKELGSKPAPISKKERPRLDAMAEMSQWLEHPSEFGRPPDQLELYDQRRLFWPPTGDERDVWLFRYRYDEGKEEGVGMVGSITFALFGESTVGQPPEDIYALHCCWELQMRRDPRAPKKLSARAGWKLLGFPAR